MPRRLITTTVRFRPEIHAYAKQAAELNGTSLAEFIRECVVVRIAFIQGMMIEAGDERWERLRALAQEIAEIAELAGDP